MLDVGCGVRGVGCGVWGAVGCNKGSVFLFTVWGTPLENARIPILLSGFKIATLQETICTRTRCSNHVSGLIRALNSSDGIHDSYVF